QQRHALSALDAEAAQRVAGAAGQRSQLVVGGRPVGRHHGGTRAAAGGDVVVEEGGHRVGHGRVTRHDTIGGRRRTTRASTTWQTMKRASPSATQAPAARQRTGSASNKASRPSAGASPT